ncbi:MAG: response regulator [Candidatus Viridilinea halotolerans]|uniref:Response regulator n=1 Tax=Candidatus Viridilinea halotolerans TaxID=2491704 RepID=A0A426TWY8_9CHLR|nr:MAG: response regulator [Candidatus Viridilinea halotolerans]
MQARILVVDDIDYNRDILARRLKQRGYTVDLAADGGEAVRKMRISVYDLVLLDLMMPVIDGYGVLEVMREDTRLRTIPVIVVSALDELDSVVRCIELGAEDYLIKPINSVLLHAKVDACLERKRLRDHERASLAAARLELELARRTQAEFLPATLPQRAGWDLAAAFHPAREVAGDFYDAFDLAQGRIGLMLGDVCDKGAGAALFMALTRSLLRAYADQACAMGMSPLQALELTNNYLIRHHRHSRIFVTLWFAILDAQTGTLRYINAGHPAPVLLRRSGQYDLLEATGPALAISPEATFPEHEARLEVGDALVAYTDGASEARDANGILLDEERVIAALGRPEPSATALLDRIVAAVQLHTKGAPLEDDITMLAVRRI